VSRTVSTLLGILVLLGSAAPAAADEVKPSPVPGAGQVIPGEVVVTWRDAKRGPDAARAHGLGMVAELGTPAAGATSLLSTGGRAVDAVLAELRSDPAVASADPNYRIQLIEGGDVASVGVNDPMTGGQYSLDQMRVRDAWSLSTGRNGVIAVLDTGVQANHPDLVGRVLTGYDFVNNDTNAADDNGHGTWVAGIIAANANDGYGIAGISWTDKILPVKIMGREGTGDTADLLAAILWAADHGATVINMSVGGFPYAQTLQDAVNYAWNKGVVLVGAAGNNARAENFYPASFANVVSVSATQVDDEFAYWSSYGSNVDVSAPGGSVQTTNCTVCTFADHDTWGSHTYISGTSFATPNTAGVIALIRARYPTYTAGQVVSRLFSTVDDRGYTGYDIRYGRGRVNAYRALGASVAAPSRAGGDALESNNSLSSAKVIPLATATRPSIYPAGDVDHFAVDVPRAGRLDVTVTGINDVRAYPYNKSILPIDPVITLYDTSGKQLLRVDNTWQDRPEVAHLSVGGARRIIIAVSNYWANGNRAAYSITPVYVDTAAPTVVARSPAPGALRVSYDSAVITADFSEAVTGVGTSTMILKNSAGTTVPATVSYSASSRRATLRPKSPLGPEAVYIVQLTSAIKDTVGHALSGVSWSFTTGKSVPRIAGADRYATAAAVSASAFAPGVPVVYIATGASFPDALAGAPAARIGGGPLLLTAGSFIPPPTASELSRLKPGRIVILGGTGAVSTGVESKLKGYAAGGVRRIAGADRYATAAAISATVFPSGTGTVYVATGANYPDALAAGAAAARTKSSVLLVSASSIPGPTAKELDRLNPSKIVIMGGTGVVSDAIAAQLAAYAPTVTRVAGADRYATAVRLSAVSFGANSVSRVYIASGTSFADGLAAGPVAGLRGAPLLLVSTRSLPSVVANELKRLDPTQVIIVGGSGVVSDTVRNQIRSLWR
jgi:subtilisin family serine protease/putative cell wall-binding protein